MFLGVILRNLARRKSRTVLTVVGIAIGIATIVALGTMGGGLKESYMKSMKSGDADFTVVEAKVADISFSQITRAQLRTIQRTDGVDEAAGVLFSFAPTKQNPLFVILGFKPSQSEVLGVDVTSGRVFHEGEDEMMLGKVAADNMELGVGDELTVKGKSLRIVGIFQTGNPLQDGGGARPAGEVQRAEKKGDVYTMALVNVDDDVTDIEAFAERFERRHDQDFSTIMSIADVSKVDQGFGMLDFLGSAIAGLAIVIGGIGVMNTVMMSVFERTREIGVLRALGWSKRRVLTMVMAESLIVGVLAVIAGIALGIAAVAYVQTFPAAQAFFTPDYSGTHILTAFWVGMAVAVLGAFYPAIRATRFSPAEALRYE